MTVAPVCSEPGSPLENGDGESFNGKFRAEVLNREQFSTVYEAQEGIKRWRRPYNTQRPHRALGGSATRHRNGCIDERALSVTELNGLPNSWGGSLLGYLGGVAHYHQYSFLYYMLWGKSIF